MALRFRPIVPRCTTRNVLGPGSHPPGRGERTKIEGCDFPDELLFDEDGLTWARPESDGAIVVGITPVQANLSGRIEKVAAKPAGVEYAKGRSIGTIESARHFAPIRAPMSGILEEVNRAVLQRPRTLTDSPYEAGWFARIRPTNAREDVRSLRRAAEAREALARQIAALRVRCFAAVPDYEMFEIGIECAAVLAKLNERLANIETGEVVHLVTDDPTAPIEMARWSDQTAQPVIDSRKEGSLFHFLVRKVT